MSYKTVYLVRHGEVEEKYQNCYNGWNDIGLSKFGKNQIVEASQKIGEVDLLVSSDLKRCSSSISNFSYKKLEITPQIREKSFGSNEGLSFDEISQKGIKYINFNQFITDLGGESIDIFRERVLSFWKRVKTIDAKKITILTHGGVIRTILSFEKECSFESSFSKFRVKYGSVTKIKV